MASQYSKKQRKTKKSVDAWDNNDLISFDDDENESYFSEMQNMLTPGGINSSARRSVEILREQMELSRNLDDGFDYI